jgi:predicted  nucleic acid-binding Zn-ribbon protein
MSPSAKKLKPETERALNTRLEELVRQIADVRHRIAELENQIEVCKSRLLSAQDELARLEKAKQAIEQDMESP